MLLLFIKQVALLETSQILVNGDIISFINPMDVTPSFTNSFSNPTTLLALPEARIIGGNSGTNLFTAFDISGRVYPEITVNANSVAAVVAIKSGNKRYVAYTGSDGIIKLKKIVM